MRLKNRIESIIKAAAANPGTETRYREPIVGYASTRQAPDRIQRHRRTPPDSLDKFRCRSVEHRFCRSRYIAMPSHAQPRHSPVQSTIH